jgi:hypothetical protein
MAACSPPDDRFALSVYARAAAVPASRTLVVPSPGGPPIVGVTETSYANALVQTVVLRVRAATPGQNEFVVQAFRAGPAGEGETAVLGDTSLSPNAISRELEDRFPGIEMGIGQAYTQNKYGPFGYAIGSPGNGDRCVYAWQRIEKTSRSLLSREGGAVVIRLRLCATGKTDAELLRVFYDFTFTGQSQAYGWNPFDEPPAPPAALGATSSPIYPVVPHATDGGVEPQPHERIGPPSRTRVIPTVPPQAAETEDVEPLPGYETVPKPPSDG